MQFNDTYVPEEASMQANKPMKEMYYNQEMLQICSAIPDSPVAWETLLQRESVEQFKQETKQAMSNLCSKGHRSTRMSLNNIEERRIEKENAKGRRV